MSYLHSRAIKVSAGTLRKPKFPISLRDERPPPGMFCQRLNVKYIVLPGKHLDTSSGVNAAFSQPAPSLLPVSATPAPSFLSTPTFLLSPCLFSAAKCLHVHTSVSDVFCLRCLLSRLLRRAATMIISFNRWGPNVLSCLIDGKTETDTKSGPG